MLGLTVAYPAGLDDYGDEQWVTFETGACALALHGGGTRQLGEDAPKIVFSVDDLASARATLIERGAKLAEIRPASSDTSVSDGADPEGNPFAIEGPNPDA